MTQATDHAAGADRGGRANLLPRPRRGRRHDGTGTRRPAVVAAAVTVVAALAVTAVVAVSVRQAAHRNAQSQFTQSADQTALAIENQVDKYLTKLDDISAFIANSPSTTPGAFEGFVRDSRAFEQLPSIAGLFFVAKVEEADFEAFTARMQQADPAFVPVPLGPHEPGAARYVLTYYVAGDVDFRLPVGVDITAIRSVSDSMIAAGRAGTAITSSFQHDPLLQQIARETNFPLLDQLLDLDFFMGVPVRARDANPAIGVETGDTIGWIGAPIANFEDVLAEAAEGQPDSVGLRLTVDLTATGLGDRTDLSRVAEREGRAGPSTGAAFAHQRDFTIGGVTFHSQVWSSATADDLPETVPIVLGVGALASLLAAAVVYLRVRALDRERAFASETADRAQFQRDIVDSVTTAMVVLDHHGVVVAANTAWDQLRDAAIGPTPAPTPAVTGDTDIGRAYVELMTPVARAADADLADEVRRVLDGELDAVELDVAIDQAGLRRWYAIRATPLRGRRGGAVVVHTDITERKRSHDDLEFKANRDNLTGLLNRLSFEAEVDGALVQARAAEARVAMLFIDLDGFKAINDTHGHAVGDEILREVGRRVGGAVRASDRVARLGGDEFVVLIAPLELPFAAEATAKRILKALEPPVTSDGLTIPLRASVGVAVVDATMGLSREDLMDQADRAMYRAKQHGGGRFELSR